MGKLFIKDVQQRLQAKYVWKVVQIYKNLKGIIIKKIILK